MPTDRRGVPRLRVHHGRIGPCLSSFPLAKRLSTRRLARRKDRTMSFEFTVGQAVEYTPIGEKTACHYRVVRQMPMEGQAVDLVYRIKSDTGPYERNVLECHLSADADDESDFGVVG